MFAQIYLPVCDRCRELGEGTWSWWIAGCWTFTCDYTSGAAIVSAGVTIAAVVGVQLWAARKGGKA